MLNVEKFLRKAVAAVDNSLLREWEALKALEKKEELTGEIVQKLAGVTSQQASGIQTVIILFE